MVAGETRTSKTSVKNELTHEKPQQSLAQFICSRNMLPVATGLKANTSSKNNPHRIIKEGMCCGGCFACTYDMKHS